MGNPKILNLDDVELPTTDISIVHDGASHTMRVLTVDVFIAQQKRQKEHERRVDAGDYEDSGDISDAVELIRESIKEFFPTLPVGELPTPKLFKIFAWLNELTATLNEASSADVVEETEGETGNVVSAEPTEK